MTTLLFTVISAAVLFTTVVQSVNICGSETGCFCDDRIQPYLIDCNEQGLKKLFTADDWKETLEKQNISDTVELNVRFDFNSLEEIPAFPPLRIVSLSFKKNQLRKIENYAFKELDFLQTLDLSQNQFTAKDLPEYVFAGRYHQEAYQPIPLVALNMSYNNIHTVEQDLFDHIPSLRSLDLSNNPLRILAGTTSISIAQLMNLTHLNLAYTKISKIPEGMIHNFIDLESLDLSGNEFTEVPSEVRNSHNLRVLTLDGNLFEKFDEESFAGLSTVEDLSISNMATLRLIEARTFGSMKNLTKFFCHHNPNLNRINNAAFYEVAEKPEDWPVMEIYLNDNGLTHMDKALAAWVMVRKVDIQNNPFRCDCDLQWMSEALVDQIVRTNPQLARNLVCAEPKELKGSSIVELGLEPESFYKCRTGAHKLNGERYPMEANSAGDYNAHQGAAITVLVIGVMLIVIGLSILAVIVVKRRAIASALIAHQQIRYQRAEDEDFENDGYKSSVYRVA